MEGIKKSLFVLFFSFAWIFPALDANIAEWDEVWLTRAKESWNRTLDTYESNPEKVVSHLNMHAKL